MLYIETVPKPEPASQLTATDREIITEVRELIDRPAGTNLVELLTSRGYTMIRPSDPWPEALGVLQADARELIGIIRRLTGEDL